MAIYDPNPNYTDPVTTQYNPTDVSVPIVDTTNTQGLLNTATQGITGNTETAVGQFTGLAKPDLATFYVSPTNTDISSGFKPSESYITPQASISNQLTSLLSSNSPLMQQADSKARLQANKMGLLSSSMAVGAAQGEAMKLMTPIAAQEADTYAKAALQKQQAENAAFGFAAEGKVSAALTAQRGSIEMDAKRYGASVDSVSKAYELINTTIGQSALNQQQASLQYGVDAAKMKLGAAFDFNTAYVDSARKAALAGYTSDLAYRSDVEKMRVQSALNINQANVEGDIKESLINLQSSLDMATQKMTIDSNTSAQVRELSATAMRDYSIAIENFLKDPDFTQLSSETITAAFNDFRDTTVAQIKYITSSTNLDLSANIATLSDSIAWTTAI